jgi:hypothetical protein
MTSSEPNSAAAASDRFADLVRAGPWRSTASPSTSRVRPRRLREGRGTASTANPGRCSMRTERCCGAVLPCAWRCPCTVGVQGGCPHRATASRIVHGVFAPAVGLPAVGDLAGEETVTRTLTARRPARQLIPTGWRRASTLQVGPCSCATRAAGSASGSTAPRLTTPPHYTTPC